MRCPIEELGYSVSIWNGRDTEEGDQGGIGMRLRCGCYSRLVPNVCEVKLPYLGPVAARMLQISRLQELLKCVVRAWNPACVCSRRRLILKTSPMDSFPLEHYGHNLTHLARQGVFSPLVGYEASVARIFQILLQQEKIRNKYNPLLVDLDGMRRWRVVIEVVRRMVAGEAPDPLPTRQVIALNYEALFANFPAPLRSHSFVAPQWPLPDESEWELALADSGSEDMLEQLFTKYFPGGWWPSLEEWNAPNVALSRLQALFLAVRQSEGQILLFINHFHWLLGGEQQRYQIDASNLLKPMLARCEIQLIGACTPVQYRQYIERDAAISRRLQECYVRSDEELQQN